jgi:hypothetical protein
VKWHFGIHLKSCIHFAIIQAPTPRRRFGVTVGKRHIGFCRDVWLAAPISNGARNQPSSIHPKFGALLISFALFLQGNLLCLQDVKFPTVGGCVGDVGGQIAVAIEIARACGLPLAQRQREVCALQ